MNPRIHALSSLATCFAALVGCDAALSRFDRVDVEIEGRQAAEVQEAGGTAAGTAGASGAGESTSPGTSSDTGAGAGTGTGTDAGTGSSGDTATKGGTATSGDTTSGSDMTTGSSTGSGSGTPPDTTNPTVNAGSDRVVNAAFASGATATDDTGSLTVQWTQVSGPGTVSFVSATTAATTISATASGVYVLRLTATDAAGNSAFDEMTLTWDVTAPSLPTLTTAADSAAGPDTRSDDDTTVFLVWTASTDGAGSGFKDYTVEWFLNAACTGMPAGSNTLTGTSQSVTGVVNGSVSFKVTVSDQLGNTATTACSPAILIEQTPPPSLQARLAIAAANTVGAVTVTIDLPDDTTDVDRVVLRRKVAAAAPTCTEAEATDVTTVKTWQGTFPNPGAVVFTDETGQAGRSVMYRACIYDAAGNSTSVDATETPAAAVTTKAQILFATSLAYDGNLSGLAGADALCDTHEDLGPAFVSNETLWRAVLSDEANDAKWRVSILGKVVDATGVDIADGRANAWAGNLLNPVYGDENGNPASAVTWTGSSPAGLRVTGGTCDNWTYGIGTLFQGQLGDPTVGNSDWISFGAPVNCTAATQRTIYCISQAPVTPLTFDAATAGAGAAGRVALSVTPPADDVARSRYWQIIVKRIAGPAAPDSNCTVGDTRLTLNAPFTAAAQTATDTTATPGGAFYSYRVCGFDVHGNLIYTGTDVNVQSSP